jgi:glycosyltransferase involved in cell wall biosynthesis
VVKRVVFAVPGDLSTPTGGYVYDRRIIGELPSHGWQVDVIDVGDGFPRPSAAVKATAHLQLAALPAGRLIVVDGLAFGAMSETAQALQRSHRLVALVHHPLAYETGLPDWEAAEFRASERVALSYARAVVTTSATTARLLKQVYAVPDDHLKVVLPGTDRTPFAARPTNAVVNLLAVGSLVPRKGYDLLLTALGRIADLPWRLVVAGDPTRDRATARQVETLVANFRLGDRVSMVGVVTPERLSTLYAAADLFVLPSRYEGFGMAFTEAIAHGVPVLGTTAGAIPEAVPPNAGVLVRPDNADELTLTLMRLIGNPAERARLAAGARAAAAEFPTWSDAGRLFAQVLDAVA